MHAGLHLPQILGMADDVNVYRNGRAVLGCRRWPTSRIKPFDDLTYRDEIEGCAPWEGVSPGMAILEMQRRRVYSTARTSARSASA